ncbi:MAG: hypothetical protein H3C47_03920 [Candidatus Cloacimonetes bacterium]|nr:hypothetical protein [Candidatus Cloacimonadota bacterium]
MLRVDTDRFIFWDEHQFVLLDRLAANRYHLRYFTSLLGLLRHLIEVKAGDRSLRLKLNEACELLGMRRKAKAVDLPESLQIIELGGKPPEYGIEERVEGRKTPLRWDLTLNEAEMEPYLFELAVKSYAGASFEQFLRTLQKFKPKARRPKRVGVKTNPFH